MKNYFEIYKLLSNRDYYSLEINYVSKILNISKLDLQSFDNKLKSIDSQQFEKFFSDKINIFIYNKVEYIGLESRRIDYDKDKLNGTNWVEDAIKAGYYKS
jgi:hypothetical protein